MAQPRPSESPAECTAADSEQFTVARRAAGAGPARLDFTEGRAPRAAISDSDSDESEAQQAAASRCSGFLPVLVAPSESCCQCHWQSCWQ